MFKAPGIFYVLSGFVFRYFRHVETFQGPADVLMFSVENNIQKSPEREEEAAGNNQRNGSKSAVDSAEEKLRPVLKVRVVSDRSLPVWTKSSGAAGFLHHCTAEFGFLKHSDKLNLMAPHETSDDQKN